MYYLSSNIFDCCLIGELLSKFNLKFQIYVLLSHDILSSLPIADFDETPSSSFYLKRTTRNNDYKIIMH